MARGNCGNLPDFYPEGCLMKCYPCANFTKRSTATPSATVPPREELIHLRRTGNL